MNEKNQQSSEWYIWSVAAFSFMALLIITATTTGSTQNFSYTLITLFGGALWLSPKWRNLDDVMHISVFTASLVVLVVFLAWHLHFINKKHN